MIFMEKMLDETTIDQLETLCHECNGTGGYVDHDNTWDACLDCEGTGYIPTQIGTAIITLIRHSTAKRSMVEQG